MKRLLIWASNQANLDATAKIKERHRRYYQTHKEQIAQSQKQYRETHKEEILEQCRQYREKHREEIRIRCKLFYETHKKEAKKYREAHKERRVINKEYHRNMRSQALERLGNKCLLCGFSDIRALQIDHINGDGYLERKQKLKGSKFYSLIANLSDAGLKQKYQLLCANCNAIKTAENEEQAKHRKRLEEAIAV